MDIFLVRHGEAAASWGQSGDPGLSELGAQQAERSAEILIGQLCADTLLLSSPLARARETAAPLAQGLDRPVQIDSVFCEIPAPVPLAQRQAWLRQFMQQHWQQQPAGLLEWRAAALQRLLVYARAQSFSLTFWLSTQSLARCWAARKRFVSGRTMAQSPGCVIPGQAWSCLPWVKKWRLWLIDR